MNGISSLNTSLNQLVDIARQSDTKTVSLNTGNTEIKASNSFLRKAVNFITGKNDSTRAEFKKMLTAEYGKEAADVAFQNNPFKTGRGTQLGAREIQVLNQTAAAWSKFETDTNATALYFNSPKEVRSGLMNPLSAKTTPQEARQIANTIIDQILDAGNAPLPATPPSSAAEEAALAYGPPEQRQKLSELKQDLKNALTLACSPGQAAQFSNALDGPGKISNLVRGIQNAIK